MPHRRYRYTRVRDQIHTLAIIYEHSAIMSKSTTAAPRLSLEQAQSSTSTGSNNSKKQTKTSRARAVRSNATSWTQDDEEEDDYEFVEKPADGAKKTDGSADKAVKWLKKAAKKAVSVRKP
jgi:hypothetical protein